MLSERRKLYENRPPEGAKPARGGSQLAFGSCWAQLGRQGRSAAVFGRPGGALGTLVALLELSWGFLGRSWGVPGRSWARLGGRFGPSRGLIWTIWTMSVALREIQQKPCILLCFWASRASRRGPQSLQNRLGRPLGRLVGPKIGLEGPSGGRQGPS